MKVVVNKIIKSIIWILIILVVAFNLYNFINLNVLKKDISTIGGYTYLEVVSGSMEPTIKIGDLVLINTNDKDYKVGDIITFYDDDGTSFVTHRIIKVYDDSVVTQGDANNTDDGQISKTRIVGKYVKKLKAVGTILNSLKNSVVLVVILIIGILVCFILSTDEKGEVTDVSDDMKEFIEYKQEQKKNAKKVSEKKTKDVKKTTTKKEVDKKSTTTKKVASTKATKKESTTNKSTNTKPSTKKSTSKKVTTPKKQTSKK